MRVNAKKASSKALQPGAVFLVRLVDGTHGVGQILKVTKEAMNSVLCAFFDVRLEGDFPTPHGLATSQNQRVMTTFLSV